MLTAAPRPGAGERARGGDAARRREGSAPAEPAGAHAFALSVSAAGEVERRTGVRQPLCPACGRERAEREGLRLARRAEGGAAAAGARGAAGEGRTGDAVRAVVGSGGGRPLDPATRAFFEAGFGRGLGGVRVHTGAAADASARAVDALAYTVGRHVVFRAGRFAPETADGRKLLAHELAHVVQQDAGEARLARAPDAPLEVGRADDPLEREADLAAERAAAGLAAPAPSAAPPALRRKMISSLVTSFQSKPADAKACVAHFHGEEKTALAVAQELRGRRCVNLMHFDTVKRPILFEVNDGKDDHACEADPNRIFTDSGWDADPIKVCRSKKDAKVITTGDPKVAAAAKKELRDFAEKTYGPRMAECRGGSSSKPFDGPLPVVALHNNQDYNPAATLKDVLQQGIKDPADPTKTVKNPSFVPGHERDDFILVTQEADFHALRGKRNVALQGVVPAGSKGDDGSISVRLQKDRFVNVEKEGREHAGTKKVKVGRFETRAHDAVFLENYAMAAQALDLVGAPEGACGAAPAATPASTPAPSSAAPAVGSSDWLAEMLKDIFRPQATKLPTDKDFLPHEAAPATLPKGCVAVFADQAALDAQRDLWKARIARLPMLETVNWLLGLVRPDKAGAAPVMADARKEVVAQRDCLFKAMDSALAAQGLKLPKPLPGETLVRSDVRDVKQQDKIWTEKFNFTRKEPFDQVSDFAKTKCGLPAAGVKWNTGDPDHKKCWASLSPDEKQKEILMASSAPGVSRHHWGTDFDIGVTDKDLSPGAWTGTGQFADTYRWMARNAATYGFIQPFSGQGGYGTGYITERWHWSYYPVAQALLEFVRDHQKEVAAALDQLWNDPATKTTRPEFTYIAAHWKLYMFNVGEKGWF